METYNLQFSTMALANGLVSMIALPFVFLLMGRIVDHTDSKAQAAVIPPAAPGKAVMDEA